MAELLITLPTGMQFVRPLGSVPQIMGRDPSVDIHIDDPSASRHHARILSTPEGYVLQDLDSKNGTMVNGQLIRSHVLRPGDMIFAGSVQLDYRDGTAFSTAVVIADKDFATHATSFASNDQRIELSQKRLEQLLALSERLTTLQDQERLLEDALSICFDTLRFERGAIGIRRAGDRTVSWPVVRHLHGAEGELTISRTILRRALEAGERAIFTEDSNRPVDPTMSIVQQGIRAAMCVPLLNETRILGVIYGDRQSTTDIYSKEDIDFLAGIARQVSIGLINGELLTERAEMVRITRDINIARDIQRGLFPAKLPHYDRIQIAAINDPGDRVSGDYYDVIEHEDGRIWILIADVAGEGVPASLLMANFQAAVRVSIEDHTDTAVLLTRWNRLICRNSPSSRFITCALVCIEPEGGLIRFAIAGHYPPLISTDQQPIPQILQEEYEPGYPLGVVEDAEYVECHVTVTSPFKLFLYTDGVVEAMSTSKEQFGDSRLFQKLTDAHTATPKETVHFIRDAVHRFTVGAKQSDDITMVSVRVQ